MSGLLHHLLLTLRLNFRSRQAIIYGYVVPIFFLFALASVYRSNPPLLFDMGSLLTVTILGGACFGMPTAMVAERERGVWRRYRLLPTATGGIILSAMIARFVIVLSAAVIQIGLARLVYKTPFPDQPWKMAGAFVVVSFAFLGLGLVIAMVSDNVPAVQAMGQAIFLPLIIVGGVGVHLELLPAWARHLANFLPGRYAIDVLQVFQRPLRRVDVPEDLVALIVIGAAAMIAGTRLFRWDVGQKIAPGGKRWIVVAILGWLAVGVHAEWPGIHNRIAGATTNPTNQVASATSRSVDDLFPDLPATTTQPGGSTTEPATAPPTPKQPWELVTDADIDSIKYDDLPDDNSTNTPLAADLNNVDDETKKRMEAFNDFLPDWPPGDVADVPQRIRNLLSIAAVADIAQDRDEPYIPYVIFRHLMGSIPKDKLIKGVTWAILHDGEGTVFTSIKDIKELGIDQETSEEETRYRIKLYGKKLLWRLLNKKPAPR